MSEFCHYLDHYPMEKHYDDCRVYLHQRMDWRAMAEEIAEKGVIFFDISDVISLFPHLELDESYKLICYLSSEYHGIWGRVAAIRSGVDQTPVIDPEDKLLSKAFSGTYFKLPEAAAPPMEAVYNDGTAEGYFEAVLCSLFLSCVPYTAYERKHWDRIMTAPPANIDKSWKTYITIPDWRPRAIIGERPDAILAFRWEIENGFGSSSGCDRIFLTKYSFHEDLKFYHAFSDRKRDSMYQGQIDDDERYTDKRRCCVFSVSSILVTEESRNAIKF